MKQQMHISVGVLWMLLLTSFSSMAQNASVELTVSATQVRQGSLMNLTVGFLNCTPSQASPPQVKGLEFHSGPMTSTHRQWVNGVSSAEDKYTYRYWVRGEGEINISGMVWDTDKGKLKSQPVRIMVLDGAPQPKGNQRQGNTGINQDLMTAIEPSKRTVFLGEPLVLSYRIYNRYNNLDVKNIDIPELEGFWKETIEDPEPHWEPQVINGKRYNVATVRRVVAFPQQTGTFELKDFNISGFMRINFFDGREIGATCRPVKVEVLPLPEAAPSGSLGTFGQLVVNQTANEDSVSVNDAVQIEITFKGKGNLKFLREPEVLWPAEFEVFDAEIKDNIRITDQGEHGARTFKYLAIPRAPGNYTLPEQRASYFDPLTSTHKTSVAPAISIVVGKGDGSATGGVSFTHQQDVQVLNQDIRHIQLAPSPFIPKGRRPWLSYGWMLSFGLGPAAFAWLLILAQRGERERLDPRGTKRKRALRSLNQSLAKAEDVQTVGEAMEQYLMAKLGWERSMLHKTALRSALQQHVPDLTEQWIRLWDSCEMNRYGGMDGQTSALADELKSLAEQSENQWT